MEKLTLPLPESLLLQMRDTRQNPRYHAEGSVLAHTQMVLEQYLVLRDQFNLSENEKNILYWAAVLHDIGKPGTAVFENSIWRSPGHERYGTPMAMNLLLQLSPLDAASRLRVLELVRWHGFPLRWAKYQWPMEQIKLMGLRTDIRLLSVFGLMDFMGRISVDHHTMAVQLRHLVQTEAPRAVYELGKYVALQQHYLSWNLRHRNAAWNAVKLERISLIHKLLEAPQSEDQIPPRKIYITIGPPQSGKSTWLKQHMPDAFCVDLSEYMLTETQIQGDFDIDRKIVELRYFVSIYLRNHDVVVLEGRNLDTRLRTRLNELLRDLNAEIIYLVFESSLDTILERNAAAAQPADPEFLRKQYMLQDLVHPWEAHQVQWIPAEVQDK